MIATATLWRALRALTDRRHAFCSCAWCAMVRACFASLASTGAKA